ncbi:hypothetical protein [Mycolicibacterium stellerae]|uniref:hypothetical protein n=1 Tax=Mycolicibacterium stellerae TaxID=2358193 RepID=UPI0013DE4329|nr:hypothetical protein [Mycolicibacterium stellerae]
MGGAAVCIGLLAETNVPDAHALSILLPGGNGNATQINILEGNVFLPQFGLGGDGSNSSNNRTIGSIIFGGSDPTGRSYEIGTIALGGATGSGNVTQINVLSYNIINPQASIFGNNTSVNTTVSNVSAGNGNGQTTTSADSGSLFGPALGSGNTTQLSLFSSNIFNPQISLFGSNLSQNTAVTNVSAGNGNGSPTTSTGIFGGAFSAITGSGNTNQVAGASGNIFNPQYSLLGSNTSSNLALTNQSFFNGNFSPTYTEGGGLGAFMVGLTGSGNSNQVAGLVSNIFNPQGTFGGVNVSENTAGSNNAGWNGQWSPNDVSSGGNNTILGQLGSGNANQIGNGNGNIVNEQFRLFTGLTQGQQQDPVVEQVQTTSEPQEPAELTNAQISSSEDAGGTGAGTGSGSGSGLLLDASGQPTATAGAGTLGPIGQRVADAVKNASDTVKGALGLSKPKDTSADSSTS